MNHNLVVWLAVLGVALLVMGVPTPARSQTGDAAPPGSPVSCQVAAPGLNLRSGPGTQYGKIELMTKGTVFTATARLADVSWLYGTSPNHPGWTTARFLSCPLDLPAQLPVSTQFTPTGTSPSPPIQAAGTPTATNTAAAAAPAGAAGLTLLQPLEARISGQPTFQWQTGVALSPNQAFELIFWEVGREPLAAGFSLVGPKRETTLTVNLDKLAQSLPQLQVGKEYQWGVLLVQVRPYRRLQALASGHRFLFAPNDGSTGSNKDRSAADEVPPPPKAPPK